MNAEKDFDMDDYGKEYTCAGILNPLEQELLRLMEEHNYARPWNWRVDTAHCRPAKWLFSNKPSLLGEADDEIIDVNQEEPPKRHYPFDADKAREAMTFCERHVANLKPDEPPDWEDRIQKDGWSSTQHRLFNKIMRVLHSNRLSRLTIRNHPKEAIMRRNYMNSSAKRVRHILSAIAWDQKLTQWLHITLLNSLGLTYLAIYLDILQTIRSKASMLIDRMLAATPLSKISPSNAEQVLLMMDKPWDPLAASLSRIKPMRLPGAPIFIWVPSHPSYFKGILPTRLQKWHNYFSSLGRVLPVQLSSSINPGQITVPQYLDAVIQAVQSKVVEVKNVSSSKSVVLVGMSTAALIACQVAIQESVAAVICLGFPVLSVDGYRGEPDDPLLEMKSPVFFVIGQIADNETVDVIERLRVRMTAESGLLIVDGADDALRMSKAKKRIENITQAVVDRCILDEIVQFLGAILARPNPSHISMLHNTDPRFDSKSRPEPISKKFRLSTDSTDYPEKPYSLSPSRDKLIMRGGRPRGPVGVRGGFGLPRVRTNRPFDKRSESEGSYATNSPSPQAGNAPLSVSLGTLGAFSQHCLQQGTPVRLSNASGASPTNMPILNATLTKKLSQAYHSNTTGGVGQYLSNTWSSSDSNSHGAISGQPKPDVYIIALDNMPQAMVPITASSQNLMATEQRSDSETESVPETADDLDDDDDDDDWYCSIKAKIAAAKRLAAMPRPKAIAPPRKSVYKTPARPLIDLPSTALNASTTTLSNVFNKDRDILIDLNMPGGSVGSPVGHLSLDQCTILNKFEIDVGALTKSFVVKAATPGSSGTPKPIIQTDDVQIILLDPNDPRAKGEDSVSTK